MQLIEDALKHAAQVVRPYQVDHHLEPDAMRGSEQFLSGQYAPRNSEGNLVPILNAEAARVDTLRTRMMGGVQEPQDPNAGAIVGHQLPDDSLTNANGDPRRASEVAAPATDAAGKPIGGPVSSDPSWMAAAKAAGWNPSEPAWQREARAAGWTRGGPGARSDVATPQPGQTGRVPDYTRLSAMTESPSITPIPAGQAQGAPEPSGTPGPTEGSEPPATAAPVGGGDAADAGAPGAVRTPA